MKKLHILTFLLAFSAIATTGCVYYNGRPTDTSISSIKLSLDKSSFDLVIGDGGKTFTPKLSVEGEDIEITDNKVTIAVLDSSIASVDATEIEADKPVRIKGLAEGSTTITVVSKQDSNANATISVNVRGGSVVSVTGLTLAKEEVSLDIGETEQISYTVLPENANNKEVTYSCSDETIAKVSTDGVITAVKNGSASISVTTIDGGFSKTIAVTVKETVISGKYYLMGSTTAYGSWTTPKKAMEFKEIAGNSAEVLLTFTGNVGDEVKVAQFTGMDEEDSTKYKLSFQEVDVGSGYQDEDLVEWTGSNFKLKVADKLNLYFTINASSGTSNHHYWFAKALN